MVCVSHVGDRGMEPAAEKKSHLKESLQAGLGGCAVACLENFATIYNHSSTARSKKLRLVEEDVVCIRGTGKATMHYQIFEVWQHVREPRMSPPADSFGDEQEATGVCKAGLIIGNVRIECQLWKPPGGLRTVVGEWDTITRHP